MQLIFILQSGLRTRRQSVFCFFEVFDAVFPHKAFSLWFGCRSVVSVRSMSVAPSRPPPPTLVLLNEWCGSLAAARSRASSSSSSSTLIDQPTTLPSSLAPVQYLNSWIAVGLDLCSRDKRSFLLFLKKFCVLIGSFTPRD